MLLLADCTTKEMAVERLVEESVPHEVMGDVVRFTLAFNPGAAMGISLGPSTRELLTTLSVGALILLAYLYRHTEPGDRRRVWALALLCGGAVGNLYDRVRSSSGVVDFIDVGIGQHRFWTFNIADMGVTIGAIVLAYAMWREEQRREAEAGIEGEPAS